MECEEVQICDICGDAGYDDELAICGRCNDSAEHIYCMATMLDRVPLQWVCERCEMEERGFTNKRLACSEPLPIKAVQKQGTDPFSCSEVNEAKSVVNMPKQSGSNISPRQDKQSELSSLSSSSPGDKGHSKVQAQTYDKEKSRFYLKQMPAVKECLSTHRPEGAAVKAAGLLSSTSRTTCKVSSKGNLNIAEKNELNQSKFFAEKPSPCSKQIFSRSSSFPVSDDQLTFLLPSRPKDLKRSKSTVIRPSACWTGNSNSNSSNRDENSTFVKKEAYNGLSHSTHGCARHGASHIVETFKPTSLAGPKAHNEAGKHKQQQYDWSARDSGPSQFHGCISDYGKETVFRNLKGSRRCFKCDEVGHVAAQCKYSSSSTLRVTEAKKALASFDKTSATNCSVSETPMSLQTEKELNSPKKTRQWKALDSLSSFKLANNQTQISGKEGLVVRGRQLSPKVCESQSLNEKHMREQVLSPKCRTGVHGRKGCAESVQGSATLQQAQGVSAVNYKQSQGSSNLVSPSNPCNVVGSGEVALREARLVVDTFSEAHCEILAEPCVQILWSGCFSISRTCLTAYNGMQAHASMKADPRVSEAMKSFPFELHLEELKRGVETDTWPRSLQNQPPTSSSIDVYFFPVDMECHDTWYKPLLDHLVTNDLALRTTRDFFQLLIFPSHLLPEADQCWDERQYLWGIVRSVTFTSSHTVTIGETF